jgi:hypothetical protein
MAKQPEWTGRVDRALAQAAREVRLLGAATPLDAAAERARLGRALETDSGDLVPRWTYAAVDMDGVRRALEAVDREIARAGAGELGEAYAARVRELDLEAELCSLTGTAELAARALARFGPRDPDAALAATALAASWLREPRPEGEAAAVTRRSDGIEPDTLLARMRDEVGRRKLPFAVHAHPELAPLAATGERVILVAAGRHVTDEDVARTILHEVEGHALPQVRASSMALGIFSFGTARGADDQEGRAILLEERAGFLTPRRRRMLAARHLAVGAMTGGAPFADVARMLAREHGLAPAEAVLVAERAFRGGDGRSAGLGRERVYLESYLRVRARFEARPEDERVMAAGQVGVDAIAGLAEYT